MCSVNIKLTRLFLTPKHCLPLYKWFAWQVRVVNGRLLEVVLIHNHLELFPLPLVNNSLSQQQATHFCVSGGIFFKISNSRMRCQLLGG